MYATLTPAEELAIDNITQSVMDELLVTDASFRGAMHKVYKRSNAVVNAGSKIIQAAKGTFDTTDEEKEAGARRKSERLQLAEDKRSMNERHSAEYRNHNASGTSDPGGIMQESHHHKQMQHNHKHTQHHHKHRQHHHKHRQHHHS